MILVKICRHGLITLPKTQREVLDIKEGTSWRSNWRNPV
jgi:bifunctional DNA-binding transcriptional regulator/antitoxin component of YhaV-PrlF toxin-antitoxin module